MRATHIVKAKRNDLLPLHTPTRLIPNNQRTTRPIDFDCITAVRVLGQISQSRVRIERLPRDGCLASHVVVRFLSCQGRGVEGQECAEGVHLRSAGGQELVVVDVHFDGKVTAFRAVIYTSPVSLTPIGRSLS